MNRASNIIGTPWFQRYAPAHPILCHSELLVRLEYYRHAIVRRYAPAHPILRQTELCEYYRHPMVRRYAPAHPILRQSELCLECYLYAMVWQYYDMYPRIPVLRHIEYSFRSRWHGADVSSQSFSSDDWEFLGTVALRRGEVGKCDTLFDLRPRIRLGPV